MLVYEAYIFDLDGTVYLGDELLPTAGETITTLRQLGKRTLFLSNNPTHTRQSYSVKLTRLGLPTPAADIINSSAVMVDFLRHTCPQARLFVIGEEPLCTELQQAGFTLTDQKGEVEVVVVSFDRTFTYHKLQVGFDALRAGARFFATNGDKYCPVPGGGEPDAGAIISALEACTGRQVEEIVGKPSRWMAETVLQRLHLPPGRCLMVGDRLETDVLFGLNAGMASALTLTGATTREMLSQTDVRPMYVVELLAELLTL